MSPAAGPPVVIAGGGTGGHLYPGLALAQVLAERGCAVTFVGSAGGIEARVVPAAGFPLRVLPAAQLRGGGVGRALSGIGTVVRGVRQGRALIGQLAPRLVVGVGGYASVAVVLAAWLGRVPTLILEQNVVPGAANRLLGKVAWRVCLGFAEAARFFPTGRAVHTGNPVRTGVMEAPARLADGGFRLLVFGGSAGARRLNQVVLEALAVLGPAARGWRIIHQTGTADLETVRVAYTGLSLAARVEAFIDDMGAAYADADLVLARAGAMSCAELAARGLPAVLVPYPYAADDHQRRNAEVLVTAGAAEMILERELSAELLATRLGALANDPGRRAMMAAAARALGRPAAAARVAEECMRLLANA
jgi:UDP-N-acetylglucosamine--N-acetylmuramyl-(pentapeptide) pyrophosphoryl-undecaprenol N-acetylglucosamine transferase